MQKGRKQSDLTVNSPINSDKKNATHRAHRPGGTESIRSSMSHKSKYSSSSKLTKSQLFSTLSRKGGQERNDQIIKERETEI